MARRGYGRVLLALALFVLFYFAADYMLTVYIDPLHEEGLIPGTRATWRFYAGLLKTVPTYVGLAASLALGVLADKLGRRRLIAWLGVLMGLSLASASAATGYLYLLLALTLFGVGRVGVSPAIYAFVPDVVPEEKMGLGYAAYYTPTVLGFIVGILVGLALYWRSAYLALGAATLATALLFRVLTRGVREGGGLGAEYRLREALGYARKPTVVIMMLQVIPWTIPWGFITFYAVDYLTNMWGISAKAAGAILVIAALSIAVGHVLGGVLADRRLRRGDELARVKVSALGIAAGWAAMAAMLAYPYPYGRESLAALAPPALLAGFGLLFSTFAYPNLNSVISECVPPRGRGTVFALYNVLNTAGWAAGPALYGFLVALLAGHGLPLRRAMLYSALGLESLWLVSLAAWLLAARYYPRDRVAASPSASREEA